MNMQSGLTLIEIIVALAMLAIIGVVGFVALNPAGQIGTARNNQRTSNINTILIAIRENIADTRTGIFNCTAGDIPTSSKKMASGAGNYDLAGCLLGNHYIDALPHDPSASSSHYISNSDYDTGYFVIKNASTGKITVSAPYAEFGKVI